ncbi:MAG: glycosyltransferase family 4 protein [Lachnospiraceae bacterium]|nr:glycosyltransferase family 4 protein [Lachnospiraceae bacterium]
MNETAIKILWICAFPPAILKTSANTSHKEGWTDAALKNLFRLLSDKPSEAASYSISLAIAFAQPPQKQTLKGRLEKPFPLEYYSFPEDFSRLESLDSALLNSAKEIVSEVKPDILHIYGSEYPHGPAFARAFSKPEKTLVSLQGLMGECALHYRAGLPENIWKRATLRDFLRKDSLREQQKKFFKRAAFEKELLTSISHVAGRTAFDRQTSLSINPALQYHPLGETLRDCFYAEDTWSYEKCRKHSLFLSQGNYPLKGAHRILAQWDAIKNKFPDASISIAGDLITAHKTLKDRLKLSSYGKYLLELSNKKDGISFLGKLDAKAMKAAILSSHVTLVPSSIENSSNSLGEGMMLGAPCAAAKVGGIESLAKDGEEALLYDFEKKEEMLDAIFKLFQDARLCGKLGTAAKKRALALFNPAKNAESLLKIYQAIQTSDQI